MKNILLSNGKMAMVDDADHDWLNQYRWHCALGRNTCYAKRNKRFPYGQYVSEQMHRMILGLRYRDGKITDHINRNGLDNRRENLRVVTASQNSINKLKRGNLSSYFRGVSRNRKKWKAQITVGNQCRSLGLYTSEIDAALAYNRAAIQHFGKLAQLNQPEGRFSW